jgi:hypothetical protein
MALTSTVLPLRTAVHPSRLSSRAPGPLRPILWVGQALGCMVSAPLHPFPVQCLSTAETDPVPHRPSLALPRANTLNRSINVPVPHRPSPPLPLTAVGSPASHTLMLFRGPRVSAVARPWRQNRICYLRLMGSVVPQIWLSRTLSSTL